MDEQLRESWPKSSNNQDIKKVSNSGYWLIMDVDVFAKVGARVS